MINCRLLEAGLYNLDEFRFAIEQMPPDVDLASSYYEKALIATERLLREKGVLAFRSPPANRPEKPV